jgi:hypothetical protein
LPEFSDYVFAMNLARLFVFWIGLGVGGLILLAIQQCYLVRAGLMLFGAYVGLAVFSLHVTSQALAYDASFNDSSTRVAKVTNIRTWYRRPRKGVVTVQFDDGNNFALDVNGCRLAD